MGKKKPRIDESFVMFDVIYQSGARSLRRKVPAFELSDDDGDLPALAPSSWIRTARSPKCPGNATCTDRDDDLLGRRVGQQRRIFFIDPMSASG